MYVSSHISLCAFNLDSILQWVKQLKNKPKSKVGKTRTSPRVPEIPMCYVESPDSNGNSAKATGKSPNAKAAMKSPKANAAVRSPKAKAAVKSPMAKSAETARLVC